MLLFNILFIVILIIWPFISSIVSFVKHQRKLVNSYNSSFDSIDSEYLDEDFLDPPKPQKKANYAETLFMGIAPLFGIALIYGFQSEIKPFAIEYFPSLAVYLLVAYLSYWLSKIFRKELPTEANLLLNYGMITGCLIYPFIAVHYISELTLLGTAIFPYLAFPLFAPLPACLFTFSQLQVHQRFIMGQIKATEINYLNARTMEWYSNLYKIDNPFGLLGFIIFLMIIQSLLGFFGQPANAVMLAFLHGSEFLFSVN